MIKTTDWGQSIAYDDGGMRMTIAFDRLKNVTH
jgi:hypothetical protein